MEDPTLIPIAKQSTPLFEAPQPQGSTSADSEVPTTPLQTPSLMYSVERITNDELKINEPKDLTNPKEIAKQILSHAQYHPERPIQMVEFFIQKEKYRISYDTVVWRNGEVTEKERRIANSPPMFSEFARSIGTTEKTLKNWAKKHEEFGEAYAVCEGIIKEFFIENGLSGMYPGQFAIFAAKNLTNMKDTKVNENRTINMKDVLDALEKGQIAPDTGEWD